MNNGFPAALKRVLVSEGGYVNDPHDPGGATNKGITQHVLSAWRRNKGLPPEDVRNITSDEVAAIYKAQYWDAVRGDDLPAGLDYVMFDAAVNSGPHQAIKWLQLALGGLSVDGVFGQATLAQLKEVDDVDALIARICAARLDFCKHLRTWRRFGRGWQARIEHVQQVGQLLATGSVGPDPVHFVDGERKARISDAAPPLPVAPAHAVVSGGVVSGTLTQVTDALTPLGQSVPAIGNVVNWLTAAAGIAAALGTAWLIYAHSRNQARAAALMIAPPQPVAEGVPA